MLDSLPQIWDFFYNTVTQYWKVITSCSVLAGFVTLAILDRLFNIFDILKR